MLEALGRSARITPLDDVLGGRSLYQPTWNVGVRDATGPGIPSQARRHSWYAEGSYNGTGFSDPAPEMKQAIDDLSAIFRDDLFTDAPNKAASGAVVTRGGYGGAFIFTGGVECAFPEWRHGGARRVRAVVAPIGDAAVIEVRFDYSFTGGGIPFQESDRVRSRVHLVGRTRPRGEVGYYHAAPEGILDLELNLTLLGYHRTQEILTSTSPATSGATGVAASRRRRARRRLLFSTIPGVLTSLSGSAPIQAYRRAGSSGSTSSASASASDRT